MADLSMDAGLSVHDAKTSENVATVLLVSMPFGPLLQPSIGLSLLKSSLISLDITTQIRYFSLQFADCIGSSLYAHLASGYPSVTDLVGEWLFARALFGADKIDDDAYIEDVLHGRSSDHSINKPLEEDFIQHVFNARDQVEPFLDACVEQVIAAQPKLVGFTSIFQQQVASLALAKRIKDRSPEICIVFGGANCEGAMGAETVHQFSFIDALVSGEGDLIFADLVQRVLAQQPFADLQGVYTQQSNNMIVLNNYYANAPSVHEMDNLPIPNYDDFFAQLAEARFEEQTPPRILFETSRGCWWGAKNHCTFCGLNGATLKYRSKSAQRALDELTTLTTAHPESPISVVDNILDMEYFKDFVPTLASCDLGVELFYEIKANLKKEQLQQMRAAGITQVQPGIESLSNQVLKLMHKGVSKIQNIQLLKWCKELGINVHWNFLWGFPGESPEEYTQMAAMIPLLTHLQPPVGCAKIRLDRFSPNFNQASELGLINVTPYPSYRYIYPFDDNAVHNLAYFFTFDYREEQPVEQYTAALSEQIRTWCDIYATSDLFSVDKGKHLLIWDLRSMAHAPLTVLTGLQKELYLLCDKASSLRQLEQRLALNGEATIDQVEIAAQMEFLVKCGFMLRENNTFLSLAIPLGDYSPKGPVLERFLELTNTLGAASGERIVISRDQVTTEDTVTA